MLEIAVFYFIAPLAVVLSGHWLTTGGPKRLHRRIRSVKPDAKKKWLIYISAAGTCRDPMAAAITKQLLQSRPDLVIAVQVDAMAPGPVSKGEVSYAARRAAEQLLGMDILRDHNNNFCGSDPARLRVSGERRFPSSRGDHSRQLQAIADILATGIK